MAGTTSVWGRQPGLRVNLDARLAQGEVLGAHLNDVDLDAAELAIGRQLQRVRGELLHRATKDANLGCDAAVAASLRD